MVYSDLPLAFREYAEQHGWTSEEAVAKWKRAEDVRSYMTTVLCTAAEAEAGGEGYGVVQRLAYRLIGRRLVLS